MRSPLLFIVLSILYPTVYLIQINSHIYTSDQIVVTLIFMFLVSLITTLIMGVIANYFAKIILLVAKRLGLKENLSTVSFKLYRAFLGFVGTLILLVLLYSVSRVLIPGSAGVLWALPYLIFSVGAGILTYRYQLRLLNFILFVLIAMNGAWGILYGVKGESINLDTKEMKQNIVFKQKPNVYLVILESYASLDIRKQIYGISNESLTRELKQKKYVTYKTYANYSWTLPSVASVFMMQHHWYLLSNGPGDGSYRQIIGGLRNNPVIYIFLNNGYRVDYRKFNIDLYHPSSAIDAQYIQPLLQPIEVFAGLSSLSAIISEHYSLSATKFFQSVTWLPEIILGRPVKTVADATTNDNGKPVFSVIYAGAEHTPWFFHEYPRHIRSLPNAQQTPFWKLNQMNNYWITTYKKVIAQSDAALIELIRGIDEKDPDATVILIGDHGTWLHREQWIGGKNDLNENMIDNGIQPEEVMRDYFEVFMAIKWPKESERSHEYFSHVNLFRHIFAVLTKDNSILKSQVSNDSFLLTEKNSYIDRYDIYLTVKDGKRLDRWEQWSGRTGQVHKR